MRRVEISAVIPVGQRVEDLEALHHEYRRGLEACGLSYEMIYVLDGNRDEGRQLAALRGDMEALNKSLMAYNESCGGISYMPEDKAAILKEREAAAKK